MGFTPGNLPAAFKRVSRIVAGMSPRDGASVPQDGEIAACIAVAGERLRCNPQDADALFVLAASRVASGRFSEAAVLLNRLIRLRVDYPGVWQLKKTVHEALGEPVAAAACARAADLYGDA